MHASCQPCSAQWQRTLTIMIESAPAPIAWLPLPDFYRVELEVDSLRVSKSQTLGWGGESRQESLKVWLKTPTGTDHSSAADSQMV